MPKDAIVDESVDKEELQGVVVLRQGAPSRYRVSVERMQDAAEAAAEEMLMYQVHADRQSWAITGKTTGELDVEMFFKH